MQVMVQPLTSANYAVLNIYELSVANCGPKQVFHSSYPLNMKLIQMFNMSCKKRVVKHQIKKICSSKHPEMCNMSNNHQNNYKKQQLKYLF